MDCVTRRENICRELQWRVERLEESLEAVVSLQTRISAIFSFLVISFVESTVPDTLLRDTKSTFQR